MNRILLLLLLAVWMATDLVSAQTAPGKIEPVETSDVTNMEFVQMSGTAVTASQAVPVQNGQPGSMGGVFFVPGNGNQPVPAGTEWVSMQATLIQAGDKADKPTPVQPLPGETPPGPIVPVDPTASAPAGSPMTAPLKRTP